jgi:hypothetical protein
MKSLILAVICCICMQSFAQKSRVTYNALNPAEESIPMGFRYRFEHFLPGQVHYKDGNGGMGRLNYNLLLQEIHFINDKGDTMALDNLETVRLITMGSDSFYFYKGIVEVAGRYQDVRLGVKDKLSVKDRQKVGAYGMANPGGSIDTYTTVTVRQGTFKLGLNENVTLAKERDFVLIVRDKLFMPLNMNSIGKAFPAKKPMLESYASANRINLKKEEDIRKLLAYCAGN